MTPGSPTSLSTSVASSSDLYENASAYLTTITPGSPTRRSTSVASSSARFQTVSAYLTTIVSASAVGEHVSARRMADINRSLFCILQHQTNAGRISICGYFNFMLYSILELCRGVERAAAKTIIAMKCVKTSPIQIYIAPIIMVCPITI